MIDEYIQYSETKKDSKSYLSLLGDMLQLPYHTHWKNDYGQVQNNVDDTISKKRCLERSTGAVKTRVPVFSKWSAFYEGHEDKANTKREDESHDCVRHVTEDVHQLEYRMIKMQNRKFD